MNFDYYIGDMLYNGISEYVLATVAGDENGDWVDVTLINIETGGRWCEPIRIKLLSNRSAAGITEEEFREMLADHYNEEEWEVVSGSQYRRHLH